MGEEVVELDFAEYGAEGGLGELGGLVDVVGDLNDGTQGVEDAQGDDGVDLDGDVVACDDVLGWDFEDILPKGDADDLLNGSEDEDQSGSPELLGPAEAEDDAALVLAEDVDATEEVEYDDRENDE
jgi:hypothetical protein